MMIEVLLKMINSLCHNNGKEFAQAIVTSAKETLFKDLTEKDWEGHEKFNSDEEMYKTFSKYYNYKVTPESKVKLIHFKLI